jgi:hypothetical protein
MKIKHTLTALAVTALATGAAAVGVGTATAAPATTTATPATAAVSLAASSRTQPGNSVRLALTPSSAQLAACMPHAKVKVDVALRTDKNGRDVFHIVGDNLPPDRDYTVFLLEQAGAPFGAAEYIGDLHANAKGHGENDFKLIVEEAFASTLVGDKRVRVDLNRVGMWFADPKDDDFCLGANSPVTPFDGDDEAGVQAFNSANAVALP